MPTENREGVQPKVRLLIEQLEARVEELESRVDELENPA